MVRAFLDRHWASASAATKTQRLAILRSFLAWLVGEGLLGANPSQNIRPPKRKRRVRSALSREDLDALIAAQPSLRDQVALMLLVYLGLRKELRRIRLADIDLEARTLIVHGKGGHVDTLPTGFEHVHNALALHLRDRGPGEHLLYPNEARERPMDPSTAHLWFKRCLKRAGLSTEWSLHDLRHAAVAPATPPRAPLPTGLHGITTSLAHRPYIGADAVRTTHEWAVCRSAAHPRHEPANQGQVALYTDLASEPHAGTDHQRQGYPHDVAWRLHADRVGLHMAQITWLFNQILLDSLPLLPCTCPPRRHRPLVEPAGRHDRLQWRTMREQGPHGHDQFSRRTPPVEDRAGRSRAGFVARLTNTPRLLARVNPEIALADLASGRTCQVRAEDHRGVHAGSPLLALLGSMPRRSIAGPPLL